MSEYAARLRDAITDLFSVLESHSDPDHPLSGDDLESIIALDGRIEALRLRLGIEQIPAKRTAMELSALGDDVCIPEELGYTKLVICRRSLGADELGRWHGMDTSAPHLIFAALDEDWLLRMRSLRAIADELAVSPVLDPEEEAIVGLIVSVGHRLTTTQILSEFNRRGIIKAESTIKGKLAQLTKREVLVNRSDTSPKGYGLPEWD